MSQSSQYLVQAGALGSQAANLMASGNPAASGEVKSDAGFKYAAAADANQNEIAQLELGKAQRQKYTAGI